MHMSSLKKLLLVFLAFILMAVPLIPLVKVVAVGTNLVSNPSVETAGSPTTSPQDWLTDQWGTNTASFQYVTNDAMTGQKSVKTTMNTRSSGDAKWYFKPVTVTPGQSYTYSTYYKSTVATEIVAEITSTTGALSYKSIKSPAKSASWVQTSGTLTMPTNAKTATIFHVINKVGWLQTDDVFFGLTSTAPPVAVAPTVSITKPTTNGIVAGTQTITATAASSGASVAGVQFKVDGINLGSEDTTAPYETSWDTKLATNATHNITAVVRSSNGLSTTSAARTVTVSNPVAPVTPTVSIVAPSANATVTGQQKITANAASSGASVAGVQFKVDGVNLGAEDTTAPYEVTWDTTLTTNASHILTADVRSTNGLSTTSTPLTVTVNNPVAPTVSISDPVNNASISGTKNIAATAASSGASVAGVQFKVDGVNLGTEDTTAPYEVSWDTLAATNASHSLTAVVRSSNSLTATSSAVTVTVNNPVVPPIDNENVIANPSVETVDPANSAKPSVWSSNKWGTNTVSFSYDSSGARTGSRSVTAKVTAITDGDAKWYFDPTSVLAGKSYLYRDYYKSTVPTRVVVAFIDANGAYTYLELGGAPTANTWAQYQGSFTAPTGAVKATVFHLIDSIGSLTIDDAYMQVATPPTPTADIVIPNGSVETGTMLPTGWQSGSWGTNTSAFQYVTNDGHTGSKSLKVTVSNYTDGDAKWFFDPIKTLTPGKQYRFNAWYKTNIVPHPVAMFIRADGTEQYFGMPAAQPNGSGNWQQYSDTFSVPLDAVSVSVFMYANQNGWIQTDDYSITEYKPTGFNRPLLSMTFDDGHEDNVTTALPLLNQYGFKSTQCYATTFIEGNAQAVSDILKFKNSGHEICSHTVTHPFMTTLDPVTLNYELQHSKQYLESIIGQPVLNFASPYGDYNATVNNAIKTYYQSHRTVDEGYNSKDNFDPYRLRVQNVLDTTSANQVKIWIEQAKADNTWLILVYHRIASDPGPYDTYTNIFAEHLTAIQSSGIAVKTYQDAFTEVTGQL